MGSRLDYCNSLLYGTTERNFDQLQRVQNTLARVVLRAWCSASAPDLLWELHWLSGWFKLAADTFNAKHSGLPAYLYDDLYTLAYQNAPVFHCTSASTTYITHFCCILFLHRRCTYCVYKHSICWQLCETRIWAVCIYLCHLGRSSECSHWQTQVGSLGKRLCSALYTSTAILNWTRWRTFSCWCCGISNGLYSSELQ